MPMYNAKDVSQFVRAGRAIFTLRSMRTGDHITYKVRKKKEGLFYVFTRYEQSYRYIGAIISQRHGNFFRSRFPAETDINTKAFKWSFDNIEKGVMPKELEFFHEGRCGRCARPLTDPVSIEAGFGPECRKNFVCNWQFTSPSG